MIAESLRPLAVPIDQLVPDPKNAKLHGERNLSGIASSYRQFGQQKNIVAVEGSNIVIAGNGQLAAAKSLGWTHIAVNWFPDEASARAFALADNRTSEFDVSWDAAILQESLAELENADFDFDVDALGFSAADVDRLIADVSAPDEPAATPSRTPAAAAGDEATEPVDDQPAATLDGYGVIVNCVDETQQTELLEKLSGEGYECHAAAAPSSGKSHFNPATKTFGFRTK